jgi:hypothetical protein
MTSRKRETWASRKKINIHLITWRFVQVGGRGEKKSQKYRKPFFGIYLAE